MTIPLEEAHAALNGMVPEKELAEAIAVYLNAAAANAGTQQKLEALFLEVIANYCTANPSAARKAEKASIRWEDFPCDESHLMHVLRLYEEAKFGDAGFASKYYSKAAILALTGDGA